MSVCILQIIFELRLYQNSLSHLKNFSWLDQWPICDRPICYQEQTCKHFTCVKSWHIFFSLFVSFWPALRKLRLLCSYRDMIFFKLRYSSSTSGWITSCSSVCCFDDLHYGVLQVTRHSLLHKVQFHLVPTDNGHTVCTYLVFGTHWYISDYFASNSTNAGVSTAMS